MAEDEKWLSASPSRDSGDIAGLFKDLDRLVKKMDVHAVTHIVVSSEPAADSFTRFVNLLALPTSHLDDICEGKLAGRFCANSGPGVERSHVSRSGLSAATPSPSEMKPPSTQTFAPKTARPNLEEDPIKNCAVQNARRSPSPPTGTRPKRAIC